MRRPLKVLFLGKDATRGGGQRVLSYVVKYLDKERFTPIILLPVGGDLLPEYEKYADTYVFPAGRFVQWGLRLFPIRRRVERIRSYFWINKLVKKLQPDILVRWYHYDIFQFHAIDKFDIPSIQIAFQRGAQCALRLPDNYHKQLISRSSLFLAEGKGSREYIHDCWGISYDRIATVCIGIDLSIRDAQLKNARMTRADVGLPEDALVITTLGSLIFLKGADLWVRMAKELLERYPEKNLYFLWVGGRPHQFQLVYGHSVLKLVQELGIEDRVLFLGDQPHVYPYLALSDIYVQPSRDDAFPHATLEAMAVGKPVVATPQGIGLEDYAQHALIRVDDVSARGLSEGVSLLIENPELRQDLGKKGLQLIRERFDVIQSVRLLEDVMENFYASQT